MLGHFKSREKSCQNEDHLSYTLVVLVLVKCTPKLQSPLCLLPAHPETAKLLQPLHLNTAALWTNEERSFCVSFPHSSPRDVLTLRPSKLFLAQAYTLWDVLSFYSGLVITESLFASCFPLIPSFIFLLSRNPLFL